MPGYPGSCGEPALTARALQRLVHRGLAVLALATALDGAGPDTGPHLPSDPFDYAGTVLPDYHLHSNFPGGRRTRNSAADLGNTPDNNVITNDGATLGRVLFCDKRLGANGAISCSSCHRQALGLTDQERLSRGFEGGLTRRRSMGHASARFCRAGKFFWDERAATLEDQALMPFRDPVEMGLTLAQLETLVRSRSHYPPLFEAAFGSQVIDSDRIARASAQFVRSIVSFDSRHARGRSQVGSPLTDHPNFSAEENLGQRIFVPNRGGGRVPCTVCHQTKSFSSVRPRRNRGRVTGASNNGLDASAVADRGVAGSTGNDRDAGNSKEPSLRNVGVGAP